MPGRKWTSLEYTVTRKNCRNIRSKNFVTNMNSLYVVGTCTCKFVIKRSLNGVSERFSSGVSISSIFPDSPLLLVLEIYGQPEVQCRSWPRLAREDIDISGLLTRHQKGVVVRRRKFSGRVRVIALKVKHHNQYLEQAVSVMHMHVSIVGIQVQIVRLTYSLTIVTA